MSKIISALIIVALSTYSSLHYWRSLNIQPETKFQDWKKEFMIRFGSEAEQNFRKRIFQMTIKQIDQHNQNPQRTYDMGVNQFSSLTQQQFKQMYLNNIDIQLYRQVQEINNIKIPNIDIDWTQNGAVTIPKNQGQCGASWAFSCIGGLEGICKIVSGELKAFSQQQLIDCSGAYGNRGCTSGTELNAYKYVRDKGICLQSQYPYKAAASYCKNCTTAFRISGYTQVKNCNDLAQAIINRPVSVTVDASNWVNYKNGIFNQCSTNINYAVLLVGIVSGSWKVKNSWGTSWGEAGYIRLVYGNTCGICMLAVYPNVVFQP